MKIATRYGRLESRTFKFSRYEIEMIVRDHISAKGYSVAIPLGSKQTASTPFYWREDWDEDDRDAFLSVTQEFARDVQESAASVDAVDPQVTK
jgi:hypothetical protein